MNDELTTTMTRLQEPAAPSTIKSTVMARIARDADRQRAPAAAKTPVARRRDLRAWLATTAGLALVLWASVQGWLAAGSLPDFTAPLIGPGSVSVIPMESSTALIIGFGLLVYLAGLFAPLRAERQN